MIGNGGKDVWECTDREEKTLKRVINKEGKRNEVCSVT